MFNLVLETLSASALPVKSGWAMVGIAEDGRHCDLSGFRVGILEKLGSDDGPVAQLVRAHP
jgi:hypothetical protein